MLVASVQSLSVDIDIDVDETKSSGTPDRTFYHPHVCKTSGSDCGVALNDCFALYACRCQCVCVCVVHVYLCVHACVLYVCACTQTYTECLSCVAALLNKSRIHSELVHHQTLHSTVYIRTI